MCAGRRGASLDWVGLARKLLESVAYPFMSTDRGQAHLRGRSRQDRPFLARAMYKVRCLVHSFATSPRPDPPPKSPASPPCESFPPSLSSPSRASRLLPRHLLRNQYVALSYLHVRGTDAHALQEANVELTPVGFLPSRPRAMARSPRILCSYLFYRRATATNAPGGSR